MVKTYHRGWQYPGGQVEVGENLVDALCREIKEESGIEVTVSHLIGVYSNTCTYKWHDGKTDIPTKVMLDYVCKPIGGNLCTSNETSDSCWIAKDEVLNMVTTPAVRVRYQAYLDFEGKVNYLEFITKPDFELKLKRKV